MSLHEQMKCNTLCVFHSKPNRNMPSPCIHVKVFCPIFCCCFYVFWVFLCLALSQRSAFNVTEVTMCWWQGAGPISSDIRGRLMKELYLAPAKSPLSDPLSFWRTILLLRFRNSILFLPWPFTSKPLTCFFFFSFLFKSGCKWQAGINILCTLLVCCIKLFLHLFLHNSKETWPLPCPSCKMHFKQPAFPVSLWWPYFPILLLSCDPKSQTMSGTHWWVLTFHLDNNLPMCIQSVSIFCTDYALKYSIGYVATTIVRSFKQNFIWIANTK